MSTSLFTGTMFPRGFLLQPIKKGEALAGFSQSENRGNASVTIY